MPAHLAMHIDMNVIARERHTRSIIMLPYSFIINSIDPPYTITIASISANVLIVGIRNIIATPVSPNLLKIISIM